MRTSLRTLVIDSATEACSVALFDGDVLVAGEMRMLGRGHAEQLVPMISTLPASGRADRIAVALGPGSFTGIRVGLAAARALAFAWDAELLGYATPDLVAAMTRADRGAGPLAVVMTGGHGEWFVRHFDESGNAESDIASLRPQEAVRACTETMVAGSQAEALVVDRGFGDAHAIWPDARSFPLLPADALMAEVGPLYGRPPDARLPGGVRPA